MVMTVWSMLEECISQLDEPFRRSEIIGWFRRHHPVGDLVIPSCEGLTITDFPTSIT
jgi:hypothetical protein